MAQGDDDIFSILAPILGGAAKDRAGAQQAEELAQMGRDRLNLDRYQIGQTAPGVRLRTGMNASRAANFQPSTAEWGGPGSGLKGQPVKFKGGFSNPDIYGGDMKALSSDVLHQTLMSQLGHGSDIPAVTPAPKAGALDKTLGAGGLISSILGGLNKGAGNGAGGSIDLGKLLGPMFNGGRFGTPGEVTGNYNPDDFAGIDPETGLYADQGPSQSGDPNQGGLEDFYAWLDAQNAGGGAERNSSIGDPSSDGW